MRRTVPTAAGAPAAASASELRVASDPANVSDAASASDAASGLQNALLALLARQARRVPLPVFFCATMLAAIALEHTPAWVVSGWLALVTGVLVLRWQVLGALPAMTGRASGERLRIAVALSVANGTLHGLSVGFAPLMDQLERALQTILLLGLCAGSVATTAGYLPLFLGFALPVLVPLTSMWAAAAHLDGGWRDGAIAVLVGLFGLVLTGLARDGFRLFRESFEIRQQQAALNDRLQAALEQARSASQAKTRFLASASHDLRQPMHTLSLFGAALSMRPLDEASRRIAQHMDTALQSLGAQLDALLDISRLDAGVVPVRPGCIGLAGFVRRLAQEFEPVAQRRGLSFEVACPDEAVCRTDELLLDRIVRNLLDNAIKYTLRGGVRVEVDRHDGGWRLAVQDSGIGIDEAEQARVFEEFYQLGNPERDRTRGLGLGLSIVQRLAELLDLRLSLQSVPQRGTRITLALPAAGPAMDRAAEPAAPAAARLAGVEVLVVDDEEAVRQGMKVLLEGYGCRVTLARGTDEAVAAARARAPQIVLADLRLGGDDDGIAAVRRLRALQPGLAALLVSGDTAPARLGQAHAAGLRLLHKPVSAQALTAAVAEAMAERGNGPAAAPGHQDPTTRQP